MVDPFHEKDNPPEETLNLKQFRERYLNISQREFAEMLGVTRNTVNRYEMGLHKTFRFTIEQICVLDELLRSHGLSFKNLKSPTED